MDLTEFLAALRGWTNFLDADVFSDAMLTSFLRMGEEDISRELRCGDMLQIDTAVIIHNRVNLPTDYRAMDFVRIIGGKELRYKPRPEFYDLKSTEGFFTTSGNFLMVGGNPTAIDAKNVELHYFGDIPPLTGAANWVSTRYLSILTAATMVWASTKMEDPEAKMQWQDTSTRGINALNDEYRKSIGAGSRLRRYVKGFG